MADNISESRLQGRPTRLLRAVQHVLVVSMVFLGLVRSGLDGDLGWAEVAVSVALLGWYGVGSVGVGRPSASLRNPWILGVSLLCLTAVWVSPVFAWVSFAVFVTYANALPPVAAIGAIAAMAIGTGGILVGRWPHDGHWAAQIVGPLVGAAVAGALVGISRLAAAETVERQRLLDELLATRDDLARAHLDAGARMERERLNREIHDTLAQGFTSVVLAARRARHAAQNENQTATVAEIDHVEDLAREGVEDARRLVASLPPTELDNRRSLTAALDILARRDSIDSGLSVDIHIDGDSRRLPSDVDIALLRVAQEGLTNARRHAHAGRVVVTLTYQPTGVRLDIADDGVGFDLARASRGFGLSSMRGRVEQLGGTLVVESTPGQGVVVSAAVPTGGAKAEDEVTA